MNETDSRAELDQASANLRQAVDRLHRYEEQARGQQARINDDIYAELRGEVSHLRAELRKLRAESSPDPAEIAEIEDVRRRAQEEAITQLAHARGWTWQESRHCWRTPAGNFYSRIGEPL